MPSMRVETAVLLTLVACLVAVQVSFFVQRGGLRAAEGPAVPRTLSLAVTKPSARDDDAGSDDDGGSDDASDDEDAEPAAPMARPVASNSGMAPPVAATFGSEAFRLLRLSVAPQPVWNFWCRGYTTEDEKAKGLLATHCPTADFFVIASNDGVSDPVIKWVMTEETSNLDLVAMIVSRTLPTSICRPDYCFTNAAVLKDRIDASMKKGARGRVIALDIGANHGIFGLALAAMAPWLHTYAIEPQPHCAAFISLAVYASGFADRITVLNQLAGTKEQAAGSVVSQPDEMVRMHDQQTKHGYAEAGVRDPTAAVVQVPRRTGCRGTWPYSTRGEQEVVKQTYGPIPGALDPVPITYVDPGSLVGPHDEVLFVKVDTEGFEEEVFQALEPLLKRKQIANLMMELNKPQRMRAIGRFDAAANSTVYLHDEQLLSWFCSLMERFVGYGYVIVPTHGTYRFGPVLVEREAIAKFVAAEWISVDIWIFRPDTSRSPTKA